MTARVFSLVFTSKRDFLASYLEDLPGKGVFVPTEESFDVGEVAELRLHFPEIPEGIPLRGRIAWRRRPTQWRSALRAGIAVEVDGTASRRLEFLVEFCRGDLSAKRRPGERVPTDFRVDMLADGRWVSGRARDIGCGGMFVATSEPIRPSALLDMSLFLCSEKDSPDRISGQVVWACTTGPEPGIGVQFADTSPTRRRQIARFVDHARLRFVE